MCLQQGTSVVSVPTLFLSPLSDETCHFFPNAPFYYQYQYSFFVVKVLLSCRAESGSPLYSCVEKITPILSLNCLGSCLLFPHSYWLVRAIQAFSLLNSCIFTIKSRPVMEAGSSCSCLNCCGTWTLFSPSSLTENYLWHFLSPGMGIKTRTVVQEGLRASCQLVTSSRLPPTLGEYNNAQEGKSFLKPVASFHTANYSFCFSELSPNL